MGKDVGTRPSEFLEIEDPGIALMVDVRCFEEFMEVEGRIAEQTEKNLAQQRTFLKQLIGA